MTRGDPLATAHLKGALKARAVRSGAVTLSSQATRFVLQLISTGILARLLAPEAFGLIGMVTVVTGLLGMVRDPGLSVATVQREDITEDQVSALFWVSVALGLASTVVAWLLAPMIAFAYGEPRLTLIGIALPIGVFLESLSVQPAALLRRQMRFGLLAISQLVSFVAGVLLAIVLAYLELGYWALVGMQLLIPLVRGGVLWSQTSWRPTAPRVRGVGIRPLLRFGGNYTLAGILSYSARNLDRVLIGAAFGASSLGFYTKAYQLLMLPTQQVNEPISRVAIPTLSRLQADPERFRRFYVRAVTLIVAIGLPAVCFAFVAAREIVLLVLGAKWLQCVPIFRALAPAAALGTFNVATAWIFVPFGRSDRQLRAALGGAAVTVASLVVGMHWGVLGVALGLSFGFVLKRLPQLMYAYMGTPVGLHHLAGALWRPATASFFASAIALAGNFLVAEHPFQGRLLVMVLLFGCAYAGAWLLLPDGRQIMRDLYSVIRPGGKRVSDVASSH